MILVYIEITKVGIMENIDIIKKERLRKIPGTNTYMNSLNVFVGRQRTGKKLIKLFQR